MSRYAVRISSALALALCVLGAGRAPAAERQAFAFQGRTIVFDHIVDQQGGRAVAIDDPGMRAFLAQIAATVTWQQNSRYILFTSAQPQIVSFALGDTRYDAGPVTQSAPFAPFLLGGRAYVPFDELLHALGFAVKTQGSVHVLQPQITAIDVQPGAGGVKLIARGGMPLDGKIVSQSTSKIVVVFGETGSMLPQSRSFGANPVRRIDAVTSGSVLHPRTTITIVTSANAGRANAGTDDQRDFTLAWGGGETAVAQATPEPSPAESAAPGVRVTSVDMQSEGGGFTLHVAVDGSATYDWHRLRPPDNRMWIDVHGARLGMAPEDTPVRVHQQNPDTVRIAVSLPAYQTVQVASDETGLTLTVGSDIADESAPRSGSGTAGAPGTEQTIAQAPPSAAPWKFATKPAPASTYVPSNPRLIVIDPGHGGDDAGAVRGDVQEKALALDMARRVRDLLMKRGWLVTMTRDDDHDVGIPGDTDAHMLQARDDIANQNGARLFLSIHVNSFINSGPHGATVYFYKPEDYSLAAALSRSIAARAPIKSDGIVKDKLYVLHHADMPAALVETAYISNPDDRKLLLSPQWRESIAQAIADGVGDYTGPPPAATQIPGQ